LKRCCRCKELKSIDFFSKKKSSKDGLRHQCKICDKKDNDKWVQKNPDKIQEKNKRFNKLNPDYRKKYRKNYFNKRMEEDSSYKMINNIRSRIRIAIKMQSGLKTSKTAELLGCSGKEAKEYLESKFQEGMTWDNYGKFGWHIDHIIPCSSFDLTKEEEQKKCFHYSNLQPLWAVDNLKKGIKII